MREKRSTTFFMIFLMFLVVFDQSEAWFGRRSSSSSRRSSSGSGKSSNGNSGSGSSSNGKISSGSSGSGKDDSKSGSEGYISGFINGAKEMHKAYKDMKEANYIGADKYFHARGNADAAKHGTGGRHAAKVISDLREAYGWLKGDPAEDRAADQEANEHGRNGGDPNKYRPKGLPDKYKK